MIVWYLTYVMLGVSFVGGLLNSTPEDVSLGPREGLLSEEVPTQVLQVILVVGLAVLAWPFLALAMANLWTTSALEFRARRK